MWDLFTTKLIDLSKMSGSCRFFEKIIEENKRNYHQGIFSSMSFFFSASLTNYVNN